MDRRHGLVVGDVDVQRTCGHIRGVQHGRPNGGSDKVIAPEVCSAGENVLFAVVLCQRSLAAETLTAAVKAALVRTLSGVDAAMAGQGTAVTESLLAIGLLAHVGPLTRVCALVNCEGRPLNEGLCAAWLMADKGPLVGMDATMAGKVRAARESFAAVVPRAAERSRILLMALSMD